MFFPLGCVRFSRDICGISSVVSVNVILPAARENGGWQFIHGLIHSPVCSFVHQHSSWTTIGCLKPIFQYPEKIKFMTFFSQSWLLSLSSAVQSSEESCVFIHFLDSACLLFWMHPDSWILVTVGLWRLKGKESWFPQSQEGVHD